jgi:YcxB-like protein
VRLHIRRAVELQVAGHAAIISDSKVVLVEGAGRERRRGSMARATPRSSRAVYVMGMIAGFVPLFWIITLFKMATVPGWESLIVGSAILISLLGSFFGFLYAYLNTLARHREDFYRQPENANTRGRRRICLRPDGINAASPVSQSLTRWEGITRVECQGEALYLLTAELSAFIVPRRAFSDDALFQQFARVAAEFQARVIDEGPPER